MLLVIYVMQTQSWAATSFFTNIVLFASEINCLNDYATSLIWILGHLIIFNM